ncbi:hypothetical protein ACE3MS_15295 [Paenibacillus dendritiformis]|uniref:LexA family protein n=1 Tax=Paenibacillus dendritiformis TaxID=130049 RepID=UPI00364A945C
MRGQISPKRQEIFEFIKEHVLSRGYPPTVREIGEKVGLASTSTVQRHIDALEAQGKIRRKPNSPRTIEIIL